MVKINKRLLKKQKGIYRERRQLGREEKPGKKKRLKISLRTYGQHVVEDIKDRKERKVIYICMCVCVSRII